MTDDTSPIRHPIPWEDKDFYDEEKLHAELRRVFDICHGCRRCFNLCDTFPRLFDLIDESPTGELDSVKDEDFKPVVDACTLCDMCFVNKCPYVPPHPFNVDFPHLMLRYRAIEARKKGIPFVVGELIQMDRNGSLGSKVATLANWVLGTTDTPIRTALEKITGIDRRVTLPPFQKETFVSYAKKNPLEIAAPQEKVVLYATCYGNYHQPSIAKAARHILAHNDVEVEVVYPGCCGMPLFEQGDLPKVAKAAMNISEELVPWIQKGYKILALVPSCALMMKQEWPLLLPEKENIKQLSKNTYDISEYLVGLFKLRGVKPGLKSLGENITLQLACHSRAQNMGQKAAELLRLIPDTRVDVIERCSGHGGSFGLSVGHFDIALKVGKPVFQRTIKNNNKIVTSECPLAAKHIQQGIEGLQEDPSIQFLHKHPLELFAMAYGFEVG